MNKLKEVIESRFESINKFCDSIDKTIMSKQTVYKLLKNNKPNPTLSTLLTLAQYLQMDVLSLIEIFKEIANSPIEVLNNGIN
jgi:transcriptional regulator with XRE-family HTH domain